MWSTKDIYLSTAIERKNPVRYNFYLFIYVKINLWDNMCDHSLIGKHIVAWRSSPFFYCILYILKETPVCDYSDVWNLRKNFCNHSDQIEKTYFIAFALLLLYSLLKENLVNNLIFKKTDREKHIVGYGPLILLILYWRKSYNCSEVFSFWLCFWRCLTHRFTLLFFFCSLLKEKLLK